MIDFNQMTFKPKTLTEKDIKKLNKSGKVVKCPEQKAKNSKNARWERCE